tara:strand:+ start:213 stop:758 length:546 start_codon:yes stop_codon:yes gene_type:complete
MASSDIANAIIIIIIFLLLQLFITLSIGIARIRNNWDKYKCNPAVIPFAGVFGYDPMETFNSCVLSSQADFMSRFLDPIYSTFGNLIEQGNLFTGVLEFLKLGLNTEQTSLLNLAETFGLKFLNLTTEFNKIIINISNVFGNLTSSLTVLYYIMTSGLKLGQALWEELPGTVIRFVGGDKK